MANPHGTPIWYEYLGTDADAAQAFYTEVIGWQAGSSGMPGFDYRILSAPDGAGIGGLMTLPEGAPMAPGWLIYIGVDDVDDTITRIEAAGGTVVMPAVTLEWVGRMALVADPQSTRFYVMRGASDEDSTSFRQAGDAATGHAVWNELTTPDQDAAMAFYGPLFGWRHDGAMPMGPLGDYKFIHGGGLVLGASMNTPPGGAPGWRVYMLVPDIDAAIARLTAAGGRVAQGPDPIPGGDYSLVAEDPFGARFGLVGARR